MEGPSFVSDIYIPGMLYALTLRSPVASGRLVWIEHPKLPDGFTLIAAEDIPGENVLWNSSLPVLPGDGLSHIGQPVALLIGPDWDGLERLAAECRVIVDAETPALSIAEARAKSGEEPGMIAATREFSFGDPEGAFANAASIVRGEYETCIQEHWYPEPCGAVAWPERRHGYHNFPSM